MHECLNANAGPQCIDGLWQDHTHCFSAWINWNWLHTDQLQAMWSIHPILKTLNDWKRGHGHCYALKYLSRSWSWNWPSRFWGFRLCFRISGLGMTLPDANFPTEMRTCASWLLWHKSSDHWNLFWVTSQHDRAVHTMYIASAPWACISGICSQLLEMSPSAVLCILQKEMKRTEQRLHCTKLHSEVPLPKT